MLIQNNYKKFEPIKIKKKKPVSSNARVNLILFGFLLLFTLIFGRAIYFQISQSTKWQANAESVFYKSIIMPSERGKIMDRNGMILAINEPMRDIIVDTYQIPNYDKQREKVKNKPVLIERINKQEAEYIQKLDQLALILGEPKDKIYKIFSYKSYEGKAKGDKYLRKRASKDISDQVEALKIAGIKYKFASKRRYPDGNLLGQIIGVTKVDFDEETKDEKIIGLEGLEFAYDKYLQGSDGVRVMAQDNNGLFINDIDSPKNKLLENGKDLYLSIDKTIQSIAMDAVKESVNYHRADSGSAVVMDAKTGEILAMVNYPDFDPAEFNKYSNQVRRNRAAIDLVEPGSLFKPFIVAKALDDHKVNPDTVMNTNPYFIGKKRIEDTHVYPQLTVTGIIQKSSNVGSSKLALKYKAEDLYQYFKSIGIGEKPNTKFPGEASGILRNWNSWQPLDMATMSYGYSLQMSLLQLAKSYSMFTNDGAVLEPSFIKLEGPAKSTQVISADTARKMRHIMATVTTKGGTGTRAAVDGYNSAGKSGTARKLVNGRYVSNQHSAMFAGYAPVDTPRLIIVIHIDNPRENGYYGGLVAAPIFSEIMSKSLNVLGVTPTESIENGTI